MTRLILPIILVTAAVGLFVVFTNPTYQSIKGLRTQAAQYDDALDKAQELRSIRDGLLSKRNLFNENDISRIEHALPNNVDNIRLIIDINNIAARHGLSLSSIAVSGVSDSSTDRSALAVGASGDEVGSVGVNFSVNASYDDFLSFLHDLEHSLRIVDVESIEFSPGAGALSTYSVSVRTYWLH